MVATLKDVATLAGVSRTTVSFVINDVPEANISAQTRERVWAAVEKLGFRPNEMATICEVRFKRRPSSHTIKKILATEPAPAGVQRRFPLYAEMTDPLQRRGALVRLHTEGWNVASIAGYLGTTRRRVYETMKRWITEKVYGRG